MSHIIWLINSLDIQYESYCMSHNGFNGKGCMVADDACAILASHLRSLSSCHELNSNTNKIEYLINYHIYYDFLLRFPE